MLQHGGTKLGYFKSTKTECAMMHQQLPAVTALCEPSWLNNDSSDTNGAE
jgi:hypothetical protein